MNEFHRKCGVILSFMDFGEFWQYGSVMYPRERRDYRRIVQSFLDNPYGWTPGGSLLTGRSYQPAADIALWKPRSFKAVDRFGAVVPDGPEPEPQRTNRNMDFHFNAAGDFRAIQHYRNNGELWSVDHFDYESGSSSMKWTTSYANGYTGSMRTFDRYPRPGRVEISHPGEHGDRNLSSIGIEYNNKDDIVSVSETLSPGFRGSSRNYVVEVSHRFERSIAHTTVNSSGLARGKSFQNTVIYSRTVIPFLWDLHKTLDNGTIWEVRSDIGESDLILHRGWIEEEGTRGGMLQLTEEDDGTVTGEYSRITYDSEPDVKRRWKWEFGEDRVKMEESFLGSPTTWGKEISFQGDVVKQVVIFHNRFPSVLLRYEYGGF